MKKILLLTTGGTIASKSGNNGLVPELDSEDILSYMGKSFPMYTVEHEDLMSLDSSNMQPEQWKIIAKRVYDVLPLYDGIIITHGTDTMAYTASALSFMLQDLDKSVVLTGSQLPIEDPLTDATTNLYTAVSAIEHNITGVSVAFNRKIIAGTRTVKVSTMGFDAFESINAGYRGEIFADGIRINNSGFNEDIKKPKLVDNICNNVFILKLVPGTNPQIFDMLLNLGYRGIVIEAFGVGGVHYMNRDLINKICMLIDNGVSIVVCSQCLYERTDLSIYEVGRRMLEIGVISGRDMTTEAATTKLMWALGQTEDIEEVKKLFDLNLAGEVTIN